MHDTPVLVKEIKSINQLIAAEFYGEVYGDLYEGYDWLIENDTIALSSGLYENYPRLKRYARLKTRLAALKERDSIYGAEADSLIKLEENRKVSNLQDKIVKLREQQEDIQTDLKQLKQDRNLVYVGRGWVKAGFDFGDLDARQLSVQKTGTDSIRLTIPPPEILDADINPWFIPKEVKGYELFMHQTGREAFTDEEILLVKQVCKRKLRQNALEKGIIRKAKSSGETSLTSFFQLMDFNTIQVQVK